MAQIHLGLSPGDAQFITGEYHSVKLSTIIRFIIDQTRVQWIQHILNHYKSCSESSA